MLFPPLSFLPMVSFSLLIGLGAFSAQALAVSDSADFDDLNTKAATDETSSLAGLSATTVTETTVVTVTHTFTELCECSTELDGVGFSSDHSESVSLTKVSQGSTAESSETSTSRFTLTIESGVSKVSSETTKSPHNQETTESKSTVETGTSGHSLNSQHQETIDFNTSARNNTSEYLLASETEASTTHSGTSRYTKSLDHQETTDTQSTDFETKTTQSDTEASGSQSETKTTASHIVESQTSEKQTTDTLTSE